MSLEKKKSFVSDFPHHPQREGPIPKGLLTCAALCCRPISDKSSVVLVRNTLKVSVPAALPAPLQIKQECVMLLAHFGFSGMAWHRISRCAGSFGALVSLCWPGQAAEQQSRVPPVPNAPSIAAGHGQTITGAKMPAIIHSDGVRRCNKTPSDFNNSH